MGARTTRWVSENRLQQEVFTWHWNNVPEERGLLFMVNNQGSSRINGARLKSMGVVPGVSDMIYLRPGGRPLLLEAKTEIGKQSRRQRDWQARVEAVGYEYHVFRSLEEVKQLCGWT